jgi:hypothetical protein
MTDVARFAMHAMQHLLDCLQQRLDLSDDVVNGLVVAHSDRVARRVVHDMNMQQLSDEVLVDFMVQMLRAICSAYAWTVSDRVSAHTNASTDVFPTLAQQLSALASTPRAAVWPAHIMSTLLRALGVEHAAVYCVSSELPEFFTSREFTHALYLLDDDLRQALTDDVRASLCDCIDDMCVEAGRRAFRSAFTANALLRISVDPAYSNRVADAKGKFRYSISPCAEACPMLVLALSAASSATSDTDVLASDASGACDAHVAAIMLSDAYVASGPGQHYREGVSDIATRIVAPIVRVGVKSLACVDDGGDGLVKIDAQAMVVARILAASRMMHEGVDDGQLHPSLVAHVQDAMSELFSVDTSRNTSLSSQEVTGITRVSTTARVIPTLDDSMMQLPTFPVMVPKRPDFDGLCLKEACHCVPNWSAGFLSQAQAKDSLHCPAASCSDHDGRTTFSPSQWLKHMREVHMRMFQVLEECGFLPVYQLVRLASSSRGGKGSSAFQAGC